MVSAFKGGKGEVGIFSWGQTGWYAGMFVFDVGEREGWEGLEVSGCWVLDLVTEGFR